MFFWCTSGEDGTRIEALTSAQVNGRLKDLVKDGRVPTFLRTVPDGEQGCWIDVDDGAVLIIKGSVVRPSVVETVTKLTL